MSKKESTTETLEEKLSKLKRAYPKFAHGDHDADALAALELALEKRNTLFDLILASLTVHDRALDGVNPARNIKKLISDDESESAPV